MLPHEIWSYTKIYSASLQDVPFIHMDLDFILLQQLEPHMYEAPFGFQSEEFVYEHALYHQTAAHAKKHLTKEIVDNPAVAAYNCGIIICNDLKLRDEWFALATEYLTKPENQEYLSKLGQPFKFHQNHMVEQYFIVHQHQK